MTNKSDGVKSNVVRFRKPFRDQVRRAETVEPILTSRYTVKRWLGAGTLAMLFGPSGCGKTHVALDLAMHVASGVDWRGNRVATGPVFYVAAEGATGVFNRIAALRSEREELAHPRLDVLPAPVALRDRAEREELIDVLQDEPPTLLIFDTLARCSGGMDENSTADMNALVKAADEIKSRVQCGVLFVHHSGKDESRGARGSSALRAAVDTEIEVTSSHAIQTTKQRDMELATPLHFAIKSIDLGVDEDGDQVTAGIAVEADKPQPKRKPLEGAQRIAFEALKAAIETKGVYMQGAEYPQCRMVHADDWREACGRHNITAGETDAALRMAFTRAVDKLQEAGRVRGYSDYFWLCEA